MPIENLLTKIIVNTNKLPYEKQKQLLQITQEWIDQVASGSQGSYSADISVESSAQSKKAKYCEPIVVEEPEIIEPVQLGFEQLDSSEAQKISHKAITKEDVVVNIIEERAYERKQLTIPIDFVSAGQLYKEVTKDLSAGGMFIKTKKHNKFKKNQKISMVFELSQDKKPFKLTGKVIRIESEGIAVQFHNISPFECVAIEEELSNSSE